MKLLCEAGADADHVDNDGQSPLFYAVRNGKIDCVEFLVKNCEINLHREDHKGQNVIQYGAKYKLYTVIEYLMTVGVPCPADIKRKIDRQSNKVTSARIAAKNSGEKLEENEPIQEEEQGEPFKTKHDQIDPKQVISGLTSFQQKEFLKTNAENKLNKTYCLTRLKDGVYQEVTAEDFVEFMEMHPNVTEILNNPELIQQLPQPKLLDSSIPLYDSWDKAAKRIINQLWRCNAASIFHKPVDPDRLGIPDYFEIVKEPLDMGTIKQRLNHNYYMTMQEFIRDIQLCFDNCLLFNGEESPAGQRCMQAVEEFKKLCIQLNVQFYIDEIPVDAKISELCQ